MSAVAAAMYWCGSSARLDHALRLRLGIILAPGAPRAVFPTAFPPVKVQRSSGPGNACDQLALLLIALCLQLIAHDSNPLKPCLRRRWDSPHLCVRIIICAIVRRGLAHGLLPEGTLVRALTNRMSGADGSEVRELVRVTVRLGELFVLNEY